MNTLQTISTTNSKSNSLWGLTNGRKKAEDHRSWDTKLEVAEELSRLRQDFPTIFGAKKKERFYIHEIGTDNLSPINATAEPKEQMEEKVVPEASWPEWVSPKMAKKISKDMKLFAVAVEVGDNYYFLDTTLYDNGGFIYPFGNRVRRWDEASKAVATAGSIATNKRFWSNFPELNPYSMRVLNLRTGEIVWDNGSGEQNMSTWETDQITRRIDQLSQRLVDHFDDTDQEILSVTDKTKEKPQIDFARYDASKFFDSLKYVMECLAQREKLNKLLGWYDSKVLQDQLHLVELSNLETINAEEFVKYLQGTRRTRRKVKDLNILVNTVADNMDIDQIIKMLNSNLSLSNHYQYRDRHTAEVLQQLVIKDSEEVRQSES
jgi:hypothetical protein